ncbi:Uncharacterised protein [Mycobacteroides abscessus subsp. abscessus]|nr:Uncharacterised protein [Mycobacteroides abscessus subsp. abscessus]SHT15019.1 Uncharacterised protein [Mycobacteroides abscessus subsp. abscessus]SID49552.1 Uncharacterised protein [Mycobacteroides abscessus subsp. abscessus]SIF20464.1 Uncharacterised protein [Mycobacteroides abscessus subsp. abscessus]SII24584.1 Uncharacterised protein [Mycobacteroides abscessus subsp. abscessus]
MMPRQLLAVAALCLAALGAAFQLGWWAANYISDRIDKFDPCIREGKYGW